jgi:hypothetical protein
MSQWLGFPEIASPMNEEIAMAMSSQLPEPEIDMSQLSRAAAFVPRLRKAKPTMSKNMTLLIVFIDVTPLPKVRGHLPARTSSIALVNS